MLYQQKLYWSLSFSWQKPDTWNVRICNIMPFANLWMTATWFLLVIWRDLPHDLFFFQKQTALHFFCNYWNQIPDLCEYVHVCVRACPTEPVAYVCENMLLLFMCSSPLGNHLGQSNKSQSDSSRQSNIMSSPSAGSKATQNSLPPMDASPSRPSVFPSSVYTTPTKQETSASKVRLGGACFVFFQLSVHNTNQAGDLAN